jgi:hypothetical protein
VLVIVGVILTLGMLGLQTIGLGSSEHAGKEAACMQSFSCADGASAQVALPAPHGDHDHDDANPSLWGNSSEQNEAWRREAPGTRYSTTWFNEFLAGRIVAPVGDDARPGVREGRDNFIKTIASLPTDQLIAMFRAGVQVRVARDKIEEALPPEYRNYHPPAYPPGVNLGDAAGVHLGRTADRGPLVIIAVGADGKPAGSGSLDVVLHELGHAYDFTRDGGRSATEAFIRAREADMKLNGVVDGYYLSTSEGGNQVKKEAALAETFAEAYAAYYRDSPTFRERNPNLFNYFRARDTRAWAWQRGWAWYNSP